MIFFYFRTSFFGKRGEGSTVLLRGGQWVHLTQIYKISERSTFFSSGNPKFDFIYVPQWWGTFDKSWEHLTGRMIE